MLHFNNKDQYTQFAANLNKWVDKAIKEHQEESKPIKYRILNADRTVLNAGTDKSSWFTLNKARQLVNYEKGQMIYESDGVNLLWEVF